jgi:hypothetical protein
MSLVDELAIEIKKLDDMTRDFNKAISEEWKTLDINNLPSDILVKDRYEIEQRNLQLLSKDFVKKDILTAINRLLCETGWEYRYRLKSTKKTDEELAEEYVDICAPRLPLGLFSKRELIDREELRAHKKRSFIAGRQSKDGEL